MIQVQKKIKPVRSPVGNKFFGENTKKKLIINLIKKTFYIYR